MSVALVAATAFLDFSSQVVVHAAAAFAAAIDFTSLRSLRTDQQLVRWPLMRRW